MRRGGRFRSGSEAGVVAKRSRAEGSAQPLMAVPCLQAISAPVICRARIACKQAPTDGMKSPAALRTAGRRES